MDLPLALCLGDDTLRIGVRAMLLLVFARGVGEMREMRIVGLCGLFPPLSLLPVYYKPDIPGE